VKELKYNFGNHRQSTDLNCNYELSSLHTPAPGEERGDGNDIYSIEKLAITGLEPE
jgi:hypothetical protein